MRSAPSLWQALPLLLALATLLVGPARGASPLFARGNAYIQKIPAETPTARAARHERIRERRSHPVIICHRGASAFAPENTLEAYAAAMDYGADGCEMDLRRTRDGVIILFHDDMLDRLTSLFGTVPAYSYELLLSAQPALRYGTATSQTRMPTFAAVLELARQRGMLLHLDVKEPGLDAQIAKMLTEVDTWDHVVGVNNVNAPDLARDPRLKLVHYKGPGLFETRLDVDPAAVREQLARPGDGIMVDDPRVAVRELARKPYDPMPLPDVALPAPKRTMAGYRDTGTIPLDFLYANVLSFDGNPLGPGLDEDPADAHGIEFGSEEYWQRDRRWIMRRAGAAREAGARGKKSSTLVQKLTHQVEHRMLHKDWMYHGLDGAMAAQALGRLHASEAAPALVAFFKRVDPELKKVADPRWPNNPLGWTDFRVKMYILPALGEMPCEASKRFLTEYVNLDDDVAREMAPLQYAEATQALLKQKLSRAEIEALLRSRHPEVRSTAILECRDHPTGERTAALRKIAPWALELPSAAR